MMLASAGVGIKFYDGKVMWVVTKQNACKVLCTIETSSKFDFDVV